jgi:hypothetical protein
MLRSAPNLSAVLLLGCTVVAGCNGSKGPYGYGPGGPAPSANDPSRVDPTLVVQVTNGSTASIDVTAASPDQNTAFGPIAPGQTVVFDLTELPPYAVLSAVAVTVDARGMVPTFQSITIQLGVDYTAASPFVGIDWTPFTGGGGGWDTTTDRTRTDTTRTDTTTTDTTRTDTTNTDTTNSSDIPARRAPPSPDALGVFAERSTPTPTDTGTDPTAR